MNMNDLKNSKAPVSTKTINRNEFDEPTGNIYEAISITAKRAIQINSEIKKELLEKLEEFATYSDRKKCSRTRNKSKSLSFMRNYQNHMPWLLKSG